MEGNQKITISSPTAPRHLAASSADPRKLWLLLLIAALVVVAAGAGIGTAVAMARKTVNVSLDGRVETLSSFGATVADLLKDNQISLSSHDSVTPDLNTALSNDLDISIRSARQLTVNVDNENRTIATTAQSAAAAIAQNWPNQSVTFLNVSGQDRNGDELALFSAGDKLTLICDSTSSQLQARADDTAQDLLERQKLSLGKLDELRVIFPAHSLPVLQVVRISEETLTVEEEIPFQTEKIEDDTKFSDQKTVNQKGAVGVKSVTKQVRTVDGQVHSETVISEKVLTQPVTEKITVGTKQRPLPAADLSDGVWAALARCESGGNPATNTGNGYYGLYQFSAATWRSVGGSGLPSEASAAEQTHRAQILQARSGWGQWPACSRKLGLR